MATPRYDPSAHPLLSQEADALDPAALDDQAVAAETVLGLRSGPVLTGDAADQATIAVVRQVNLQVALAEHLGIESESKGDQSFTYRHDEDGGQVMIDPLAQAIVEKLIGVPTRPDSVSLAFTW